MGGHKTYLNWSTGKDAALALYYLQQEGRYDVNHLLTAVNSEYNRVTMHGLRVQLMEQQIVATGLPSDTVWLPPEPSNEVYEQQMAASINALRESGFEYAAFGDIFLEDLRTYREDQLKQLNMESVFPLWKRDTRELIHDFLDLGFKAITVAVDATHLDASFAGRIIDRDFIDTLPPHVDPCGENGEYHSFCFDGPIFRKALTFTIGEKIKREYSGTSGAGFWFCDLLPTCSTSPLIL